jgi:hypothetical protein
MKLRISKDEEKALKQRLVDAESKAQKFQVELDSMALQLEQILAREARVVSEMQQA